MPAPTSLNNIAGCCARGRPAGMECLPFPPREILLDRRPVHALCPAASRRGLRGIGHSGPGSTRGTVDAALIYEFGLDRKLDGVVVVDAPLVAPFHQALQEGCLSGVLAADDDKTHRSAPFLWV